MARAGRNGLYETDVKTRFAEITEWAKNGATERQIAKNLGIGYSTFNQYKVDHKELAELIKNARVNVVAELRGALIRKALGYYYTETKVVRENGIVVKEEETTKHVAPDVAAINLALKNYDRNNWSNDWQVYELRRQELELRKKQIENNTW